MLKDLDGKCVVLGITGGIAAYKMADTAHLLTKLGAEVHVIMTVNATKFISPLTFETLTNQRCIIDTFARDFQYDVMHISLAQASDLILIAPATANIIAKMAHGIADDMLTTLVLAAGCPKLLAPSMNTSMLDNPATKSNLAILKSYGFGIIKPDSGLLACGASGRGRLPAPEILAEHVSHVLARKKSLTDVRVTVTAGPTQESIDPVRFITNHSSGKMGYAIAREALLRGAKVQLISGPVTLPPQPFIQTEYVTTAAEMLCAVQKALPKTDILIMTAAVADYRPAFVEREKVKKGNDRLLIELEMTEDILDWVARNRHPGLFVCGFAMETENLLENSRKKLEKKQLNMIAANNLRTPGAGFGVDTNVLTFLTAEGVEELPLLSKTENAIYLLDAIERGRIAAHA